MDELTRKLWAKSNPYHPLWCHLLDIAAVAKALLPRFGGVAPLPDAWVLYIVALHDIGKTDPYFQAKDDACAQPLREAGLWLPEAERTRGFRHEGSSQRWLRDKLALLGWKPWQSEILLGSIQGHHGNFCPDPSAPYEMKRPEWAELARQLDAMLIDVLQVPQIAPVTPEHISASGLRLVGVMVLSDWIASSDEIYGYHLLPSSDSPAVYWEAAQVRAADAVKRLALFPGSRADASVPTFRTIWPKITSLRPTQDSLESLLAAGMPPGIAILEAPMGEGKTEAAIALAEHWNAQLSQRGMYIGLPTQATSNQMYQRYRRYLQQRDAERSALLVHGMAWLIDEAMPDETLEIYGDADEPEIAREWFRNTKRALLAEDGVGTIDQALMAGLNVKHGFLRLYGLTRKTLIVDEVHAYDTYMSTILESLLRWCSALGVPVVLLSATLSKKQKQSLLAAYTGTPFESAKTDYPLITHASHDGKAQEVVVQRDPVRRSTIALDLEPVLAAGPATTAELALAQSRQGGCVAVIVNTVRDAQEVFSALRRSAPAETRLLLFHARFRAEDRAEIEKSVIELFGKTEDGVPNPRRPQKAILVATQVVEQSLDVDFDSMISQIAPIDLLLQRAGRLWRHGWNMRWRRRQPTLTILTPAPGDLEFAVSRFVYQREALLKTLAIVSSRDSITIPDDLRTVVEQCYGEEPIPTDIVPAGEIAEATAKRIHDEADMAAKARDYLLKPPSATDFALVPTLPAFDEADESDSRVSYLRARTRLGDDSVPSIVLRDAELQEQALKPDFKPRRDILQRLFRGKVNLDGRRLRAEPEPGYDPIARDLSWARGHVLIPFREGLWRGRLTEEREGLPRVTLLTVIDDPILGIKYEEEIL